MYTCLSANCSSLTLTCTLQEEVLGSNKNSHKLRSTLCLHKSCPGPEIRSRLHRYFALTGLLTLWTFSSRLYFLLTTCLAFKVFVLNSIMKQTKMPGSVQAVIFSCISPPTLLFNLGTFQIYPQREAMFELSLEYWAKMGEKKGFKCNEHQKEFTCIENKFHSASMVWDGKKKNFSHFFPIYVSIDMFGVLCHSAKLSK